MCGAAITTAARRCLSCGEEHVHLVSRGLLRRKIELQLPEGRFFVEYSGDHFGHELVNVSPGRIVRKVSLIWFAPRFDFDVGGRPATIKVRVWPWLAIRSFELHVDGNPLYTEGGLIPRIFRRISSVRDLRIGGS